MLFIPVFHELIPLPCRAWTLVLEGKEEDEDSKDTDMESATPAHSHGCHPQRQMHDIRITNQIMYLHPHIEDCRYYVLQKLLAWQAVVTSQNRIQINR